MSDVDLGERWQDECRRSRWDGGLLLRVSLWLAWWAPLWMGRGLRTFGALDDGKKVEILEALLGSRSYLVRMAAMFLKLTVCSLFLGDERALRQLSAYDLARPPVQLRVPK